VFRESDRRDAAAIRAGAAARLADGGALITSGVTAEEEGAVVQAFARGTAVTSRLQEREWIGTIVSRGTARSKPT
jgi:ribosomal protein L11 methylase PrmA